MDKREVLFKEPATTKKISSPIKGLRWRRINGQSILQYAADSILFDDDGNFVHLEIIWHDVPSVMDAQESEPYKEEHVKDIVAEITQGKPKT